jgi:hypothetical protein
MIFVALLTVTLLLLQMLAIGRATVETDELIKNWRR